MPSSALLEASFKHSKAPGPARHRQTRESFLCSPQTQGSHRLVSFPKRHSNRFNNPLASSLTSTTLSDSISKPSYTIESSEESKRSQYDKENRKPEAQTMASKEHKPASAPSATSSGATFRTCWAGAGNGAGVSSGSTTAARQAAYHVVSENRNYTCGCRGCECGAAVECPGDLCSSCTRHYY